MTDIANNIQQVNQRIIEAAEKYRRSPDEIALLAVSKTKPVADIRAAYAAGQRRFGENYLQEAEEKIRQLRNLDIEWHYIGRVQSNKTRAIAEHFDWVHAVDSLKQARRLSAQRGVGRQPLNICLQVDLSGEASKGGVAPDGLFGLASEVIALPGVRLRGLMTLPAPASDFDAQRRPFHHLAELGRELAERGIEMDTLSMGMTNDLEAAIAEGASIVRIGTAIFGAR